MLLAHQRDGLLLQQSQDVAAVEIDIGIHRGLTKQQRTVDRLGGAEVATVNDCDTQSEHEWSEGLLHTNQIRLFVRDDAPDNKSGSSTGRSTRSGSRT